MSAAAPARVSSARPRTSRELAVAAVAILIGGGGALLANARTWDTVTVSRAAPLGPFSVDVAGRTIVPAVTGLAVVALAGVVALLATRGRARSVMGVVLGLSGALLAWQATTGFTAVSDARARDLVVDARTGVVLERSQSITVATSPVWPAAALVGGLLVVAGGALIAARGARWSAMSSRYDAPVNPSGPASDVRGDEAKEDSVVLTSADADAARARADLALWQSLERGEDPTAQVER